MNHDLALITDWLRANKISLNTSKAKVVIYKPKTKKIYTNLNFRISGQKIEISDSIRYLGLHLQDTLEWDHENKILKITDFIALKKCSLCKRLTARKYSYFPPKQF